MRSKSAGQLLVLCSAVTLVACQDGVTAPREASVAPSVMSLSSNCGGQQARIGGPGAIGGATKAGWDLPGVTITATYYGGYNFLISGLTQQMNFPRYYGAELAPCLSDDFASYHVDLEVPEIGEPIPAPDGVDSDWWHSLSRREQRVLMSIAQELLELGGYPQWTVGSLINEYVGNVMRDSKHDSKLRGNDMFPGMRKEAEQLAGGCYACELYRRFTLLEDWPFSNERTLKLVSDLVLALGEGQFTTTPLRGIQFARNGAVGAGLAASDYQTECGRLIFDNINRGIIVSDPYLRPRPNGRPPIIVTPDDQ